MPAGDPTMYGTPMPWSHQHLYGGHDLWGGERDAAGIPIRRVCPTCGHCPTCGRGPTASPHVIPLATVGDTVPLTTQWPGVFINNAGYHQ